MAQSPGGFDWFTTWLGAFTQPGKTYPLDNPDPSTWTAPTAGVCPPGTRSAGRPPRCIPQIDYVPPAPLAPATPPAPPVVPAAPIPTVPPTPAPPTAPPTPSPTVPQTPTVPDSTPNSVPQTLPFYVAGTPQNRKYKKSKKKKLPQPGWAAGIAGLITDQRSAIVKQAHEQLRDPGSKFNRLKNSKPIQGPKSPTFGRRPPFTIRSVPKPPNTVYRPKIPLGVGVSGTVAAAGMLGILLPTPLGNADLYDSTGRRRFPSQNPQGRLPTGGVRAPSVPGARHLPLNLPDPVAIGLPTPKPPVFAVRVGTIGKPIPKSPPKPGRGTRLKAAIRRGIPGLPWTTLIGLLATPPGPKPPRVTVNTFVTPLAPTPTPLTPLEPVGVPSPITPTSPLVPLPIANLGPREPLFLGNPKCDCTPKKRKPRKPRTVCYKGTYTEKRAGISKSRREQVPCQ